ncbi:acetoin utilization protein AcuC [Paenibacillus sp. 1P07SE]|uniref:acetoin utilization protein AcuC n=1 Tax=Paenibacillus sp. 1P07SE TaxID=3132209 RepID=UPI0039A64D0E
MKMANELFVHHADALRYRFNDQHPFNPMRLTLTIDLLRASSALESRHIIVPPPADESLLALLHRSDYIEAVRQLSAESPVPRWYSQAQQYGLQTEDTPCFPGMHEAAATIAGGSVHAAGAIMSGSTRHAFHMAGGLHHAFPDRSAGFCVYNDAAIAIAWLRRQYDARVLYIDTDVHHGDGVQWAFYDDPAVCTYSIHETGKFLFPGTGYVHERGAEQGFGACFNVPVEPYTEDDSWLECFQESIERVAAAFRPDIIISQHGCDAHALDPLSHIHCSMRIYQEMPATIHRLAHEHAGGRWLAVGGGGYDIWRVVPRAWALVWLEMSDHPLKDKIAEQGSAALLPERWRAQWQPQSPDPLPETWLDDTTSWAPMPRRAIIAEQNRAIKNIAIQDL